MGISERQVKNKRNSKGVPTGKPGTVYDVNIKYITAEGKKTYAKRGFLTLKEAKLHEAEMVVKLQNPSPVPEVNEMSKTTLGEYLQTWFELYSINHRESTKAGYKTNINKHISPRIGHLKMKQVSAPIIDKLYGDLIKSGLKPATVRYVHRTLSVALETARGYGIIEKNPAKDTITKLSGKSETPEPYTLEQTQLLMSHVAGTEWETIVALGCLYGLRRNEILGLAISKIDLEKNVFKVDEQLPFNLPADVVHLDQLAPTKSKERTLPITELTRSLFVRQIETVQKQKQMMHRAGQAYHDNDLLICQPNGAPYRPDTISARWSRLLKTLGLPHIRFHDLRHTAATNMHELTGDFYTVGEILGHTLKGIGMTLGLSSNLDAVTSQYVDVRQQRKLDVLQIYHQKIIPEQSDKPRKTSKKSREMER